MLDSIQNRQTGIIRLIPPQNMRKVPTSDYKLYIPWARENTANSIYPCSIAEGLQPGDIYVNDGQNIESVFFWHYCGFGYISGEPSDRMLNDIYEKMTSSHSERRLVLITADDEVTAFFRDKDVQMDLRAEYTYHPQAASPLVPGTIKNP